ncbi:hypothetical protein BIZ78_gp105 [Erwinia phage vB_EamM_Caitlin]|nr:hypothetical protein BIZ78_gp105 [Erwinia phage vB_EamM_Caitlin]ANZ48470.1 hypothetical protein CAITLIN_175 [Erwinia phage vB_EamM_Caitlin]
MFRRMFWLGIRDLWSLVLGKLYVWVFLDVYRLFRVFW